MSGEMLYTSSVPPAEIITQKTALSTRSTRISLNSVLAIDQSTIRGSFHAGNKVPEE